LSNECLKYIQYNTTNIKHLLKRIHYFIIIVVMVIFILGKVTTGLGKAFVTAIGTETLLMGLVLVMVWRGRGYPS